MKKTWGCSNAHELMTLLNGLGLCQGPFRQTPAFHHVRHFTTTLHTPVALAAAFATALSPQLLEFSFAGKACV